MTHQVSAAVTTRIDKPGTVDVDLDPATSALHGSVDVDTRFDRRPRDRLPGDDRVCRSRHIAGSA
jgi:hypothetical protein